ncbi:MBL fold metallo-hydrolase [Candidatus Woesearchaeota archaeon]|nr:MBL fold metallo-hydrolase [Candidatus Woesearchaeota archaeon]
MDYQHLSVELLGHDSIRVRTTKPESLYVYFDPYQLDNTVALPKADVLFITHTHYDHCSVEDIKKIIQKNTVIVTVPDAQSKLVNMDVAEVALVRPGKTLDVKGLHVTAVPAYNTNKPFHPKENEWVGFIVDFAGVSVYVAGDTDVIPEMNSFPKIDVAFLPVSGTYVMTADEAAKAAEVLKPQVAVPMHYGVVVGSASDAEKFKSLLEQRRMKAEILR